MENTPLELYETAYKLHYLEHKLTEAILYYQRIITDFPESNECGYAVIQLQKIKAGEIAGDLKSLLTLKKTPSKLIIILLLLFSALSGSTGYLYFKLHNRLIIEQTRAAVTFNALSKIIRGNHQDALLLLNILKEQNDNDIMPYELCADIYRKDNNYDLAKKEYITFLQLNPTYTLSDNEKWFMNLTDNNKVKGRLSSKVQQSSEPSSPKVEVTPKKNTLRLKKKSASQPPSPGKSGKGVFLVDPDSLSYF